MTVQTELRPLASVRPDGIHDHPARFLRRKRLELVTLAGHRDGAVDVVVGLNESDAQVERVLLVEDGVLGVLLDEQFTRVNDGRGGQGLLVVALALVEVVEDGLPAGEGQGDHHAEHDDDGDSLDNAHTSRFS